MSCSLVRRLLRALVLSCSLGGCLISADIASAASVRHYVLSNLGTDTFYVGAPASISFFVDAREVTAGDAPDVASITWPLVFSFSNGNIIGPLGDFVFPGWQLDFGASVFEESIWSTSYGLVATDPDTLLFTHVSLAGTAYTGIAPVSRIDFVPLDTGMIAIDAGTVDGHSLGALDVNGNPVASTWKSKVFHVVSIVNAPPTCSGFTGVGGPYLLGSTISGICMVADDGDDDPSAISYFIADAVNSNATGPNNPMTIGSHGCFSWETSTANLDDVGVWTIQAGVTDGHDTAICEFEFNVFGETPFRFSIDSASASLNQSVDVRLYMSKELGLQLAGGFDLLLCYQDGLLTLNGVTVSQELIDRRWEFFTYRLESTNPHKIRIVSIADMNNGNVHPDSLNPQDEVATLHFRTSGDREIACQRTPIRFCWEDCGDNVVSSRDGYTLWIVGEEAGGIIDYSGAQIYGQDPDPWGYNATVVEELGCPSEKYQIEPFVSFRNGWVEVVCPDTVIHRGDIDLNRVPNEIADAELYSLYFTFDFAALHPDSFLYQIEASDLNADYAPLTVTDLVYLCGIIRGDLPVIPDGPFRAGCGIVARRVDVEYAFHADTVVVRTAHELPLGAIALRFDYSGTTIEDVSLSEHASSMSLAFYAADGVLRVLLAPHIMDNTVERDSIVAGLGEVLRVKTAGGGTLQLAGAQAATPDACHLQCWISLVTTADGADVLPKRYELYQNHPNPFPNPTNPGTSFDVDFPMASDYAVTIYNIAGQVVRRLKGRAGAGTLTVHWDGRIENGAEASSGVYFYRLQAGEFNAVRKMVLMK